MVLCTISGHGLEVEVSVDGVNAPLNVLIELPACMAKDVQEGFQFQHGVRAASAPILRPCS